MVTGNLHTSFYTPTYPEDWREVKLGEALVYTQPTNYIENNYVEHGVVPVLTAGKSFILGYSDKTDSAYKNLPAILFDDFTTEVRYLDYPFMVKSSATKFLNLKSDYYDIKYLYYWLDKLKFQIEAHERHWISRFSKFNIVLPSLQEQQAIASALSDFDEHIDNLTELIEKKKTIRNGALEDLVSGRTRIEGFDDEWKKTTLDDCAYIFQGGTPRTTNADYWNGDIVWVTPSEITKLKGMYISNSERKITKAGLQNSSAQILPVGTILLCTRATIGELAIATKLMTTNQGFKNFVCKDGVDNIFMAYLLMTLKEVMISKAIGTTFLEISKKVLKAIEIVIPEYREQEAIASILTAMDEEIEALEEEKEKMIQIKEGAMDDLLTGRVRLKV